MESELTPQDKVEADMLGDTETQRAWMRYADMNDIPHDHEDEEPFKQGFVAGRQALAARDSGANQVGDFNEYLQKELERDPELAKHYVAEERKMHVEQIESLRSQLTTALERVREYERMDAMQKDGITLIRLPVGWGYRNGKSFGKTPLEAFANQALSQVDETE